MLYSPLKGVLSEGLAVVSSGFSIMTAVMRNAFCD